MSGSTRQTAGWIASLQLDSGMIPWYAGGHGDPWNHSEALIALALKGYLVEVEKGFGWLASAVSHDGSFCQYYLARGVEEPRIDLNSCLYPAVAFLAHLAMTRDGSLLARHLDWLDLTVEFVLGYQRADGKFPWALSPDRRPLPGCLVAGSSAMLISLDAWIVLDEFLGRYRSRIKEAREALYEALVRREGFLDKDKWAMDWYYPTLAGCRDVADLTHLTDFHLVRNGGIQALAGTGWLTTAESAESAMAYALAGQLDLASSILNWVKNMRGPDGSFFTGIVASTGSSFPPMETTTYSAAAVVIANWLMDRVIAEHLHPSSFIDVFRAELG